MIRFLKNVAKSVYRHAVYARLRWFALSEAKAIYWAEFMKRWPAIFSSHPFSRKCKVDSGAWMRLGLIDVIERNLIVHACWDEPIATVMREAIEPGATVVDIGANIGYFSLLAASLCGPEGRVLCVEPSQRNLSRLCEHLWMNRVGIATVLSTAAGRASGWADVAFPTYNNAGAATLRPVRTVQTQRTLVLALDDVFEAHGLDPQFIKLDVEGYELEALRGMERTLRRCTPIVVCELTDGFLRELDQTANELLGYMEGLGYRCHVISVDANVPAGTELSTRNGNVPDVQIDVVFRCRSLEGAA